MGNLGIPLKMNEQGFVDAAITGTFAIGAAISMPITPLFGWLSDRINRKWLMALCFLTTTFGIITLMISNSLSQFWISSSLLGVMLYASFAVGSALVTDLVPQTSLGRGISLFTAAAWIGSIIGFAITGIAIQLIGMNTTFLLSALLPLIAIVLLIPVRREEGLEDSEPRLSQPVS
jgi:MFS family permease